MGCARKRSKMPGENDNPDLEKEIEARVTAAVEERLKPIKEKLDSAYSQRDEAAKRAELAELKAKELEIQKLKDEGKAVEALEAQLAAATARAAALEQQNTELARNNELRAALQGLKFRSDKASRSAFNDIVGELINDNGVWKHKSGSSIADAVRAYAEDEDNAYLFTPVQNSGSGADYKPPKHSQSPNETKSLFAMSQAEVLKLAKEGKLPNRRK